MLHLGIGLSLIAASACGAEPTLPPDSMAGREALWWARFHGCAEVLTLVG